MQRKLPNKTLMFVIVFILACNNAFPQVNIRTEKTCECNYFPLCLFTYSKTYNGKTYRGTKNENGYIDYYNCDNGIITRLVEFNKPIVDVDEDGYYYDTYKTIYRIITILKPLSPVGASWSNPSFDDFFTEHGTIISKTDVVSLDGKQYKNVIRLRVIEKVNKSKQEYIDQQDSYSFISRSYLYVKTFYNNGEVFKSAKDLLFDKDFGLIKVEDLWESFKQKYPNRMDGISSPEEGPQWQAYHRLPPEQKEEIDNIAKAKVQEQKDEENRIAQAKIKEQKKNDSIATVFKQFKGKPDKSLAGTWRYYNKNARAFLFYHFDNEGNFKYYVGKIDTSYDYLKKDGKYLVKDDSVVVFYQGVNNNYLEGFRISKINNAHTGKPSFNIIYDKDKLNEFENISNNSPWPGMPDYGNGNAPQPRETKLDGVIDNDLFGVWKHTSTSKSGKSVVRTYIFNKDGTASYLHLLDGKEYDSNKKFDWRYAQNQFLWFTEDCDTDLKCPKYIFLSKKTIKGKKCLVIDFKEYYRE